MSMTKEDTILAIRISQEIQDYFDRNKNIDKLSSSEVFRILEKKGSIVDKNNNRPISIRQFFKKLDSHNALDLIPQSRIQSRGKSVNYIFESAPEKTIRARRLVPLEKN